MTVGKELLEAREYDAALAKFEECIQNNSNSALAYLMAAKAAEGDDQNETALDYAHKGKT